MAKLKEPSSLKRDKIKIGKVSKVKTVAESFQMKKSKVKIPSPSGQAKQKKLDSFTLATPFSRKPMTTSTPFTFETNKPSNIKRFPLSPIFSNTSNIPRELVQDAKCKSNDVAKENLPRRTSWDREATNETVDPKFRIGTRKKAPVVQNNTPLQFRLPKSKRSSIVLDSTDSDSSSNNTSKTHSSKQDKRSSKTFDGASSPENILKKVPGKPKSDKQNTLVKRLHSDWSSTFGGRTSASRVLTKSQKTPETISPNSSSDSSTNYRKNKCSELRVRLRRSNVQSNSTPTADVKSKHDKKSPPVNSLVNHLLGDWSDLTLEVTTNPKRNNQNGTKKQQTGKRLLKPLIELTPEIPSSTNNDNTKKNNEEEEYSSSAEFQSDDEMNFLSRSKRAPTWRELLDKTNEASSTRTGAKKKQSPIVKLKRMRSKSDIESSSSSEKEQTKEVNEENLTKRKKKKIDVPETQLRRSRRLSLKSLASGDSDISSDRERQVSEPTNGKRKRISMKEDIEVDNLEKESKRSKTTNEVQPKRSKRLSKKDSTDSEDFSPDKMKEVKVRLRKRKDNNNESNKSKEDRRNENKRLSSEVDRETKNGRRIEGKKRDDVRAKDLSLTRKTGLSMVASVVDVDASELTINSVSRQQSQLQQLNKNDKTVSPLQHHYERSIGTENTAAQVPKPKGRPRKHKTENRIRTENSPAQEAKPRGRPRKQKTENNTENSPPQEPKPRGRPRIQKTENRNGTENSPAQVPKPRGRSRIQKTENRIDLVSQSSSASPNQIQLQQSNASIETTSPSQHHDATEKTIDNSRLETTLLAAQKSSEQISKPKLGARKQNKKDSIESLSGSSSDSTQQNQLQKSNTSNKTTSPPRHHDETENRTDLTCPKKFFHSRLERTQCSQNPPAQMTKTKERHTKRKKKDSIYEFLSQSPSDSHHPVDDVIKKMIKSGKVVVAKHKKGTGTMTIPRKRDRKTRKQKATNQTTATIKPLTVEKRPLQEKKIPDNNIDIDDEPHFDHDDFNFNNNDHNIANVPETHDDQVRDQRGFSNLARSAMIKQAGRIQKPLQKRKPIKDKKKLLEMAMQFVSQSTPLRMTSPQQQPMTTPNFSPTPIGAKSPWRVDDDRLPTTFYLGRNSNNLPSFSSDHIPMTPVKNKSKSMSSFSSNDSNGENKAPSGANTITNEANFQALANTRKALAHRSPLKTINILEVVNLPPLAMHSYGKTQVTSSRSSPQKSARTLFIDNSSHSSNNSKSDHSNGHNENHQQNTHISSLRKSGSDVSQSTSTTNQRLSGSDISQNTISSRRSGSDASTNINNNNNSITNLFGFEDLIDDENNSPNFTVDKTILPNKENLKKRLQRLKKLRPNEPVITSKTVTHRIKPVFDDVRPVQKSIKQMLCSTMIDNEYHNRNKANCNLNESEDLSNLFKDPDPETTFDDSLPRRTYNRPYKKKRKMHSQYAMFLDSDLSEEEEDEDYAKPVKSYKPKSKKRQKKNPELNKFVDEFNEMCKEVSQYELIVE